MSLILGVEILGEYKNLTAATKGAQSQLATLNKRMSGFSRSMNNALGAIGIGFSLGFIIREFDDMAKAAIDDSKSQTILKDTLKKTVDASDDQVASVEKSISKMQIQTGVLDDKLRPAFGKIIRSTQDLDLATQYMNLALDISAGTGKDVELVAQAIARAVGPDGTRGALEKLVPAIKGANDPMAELERLFGGAAEKAAATDPYNNLKIIFGEMQEQIGISLLPTLYKLSDWLKTPEGQAKLQALVDLVSDVIIKFGELAAWVIDNRDWLVPMVTAIGAVTAAWKLATLAVEGFKTASIIAGAISGTAAGAAGAIGAGAAVGGFQQGQTLGQQSQIYGQGFKQLGSNVLGKNSGATININVKTVDDAKSTIKSISQFEKATGTTLAKALR